VDEGVLAERLKETAEAQGFDVRGCPPDSEGAVVTLRGRRVIFVPEGAIAAKRVEIIARALAPLDLEGVFLVPVVREAIERARGESNRR
jgi:hypothetical protein